MKILYISQQFYPEMGAASGRVYELSKNWVSLGHDVTVLTSFPNYPDGIIHEGYRNKCKNLFFREVIDGIKVIRTYTYPTHLRSTIKRSLYYISFFMSSSLIALFLKNFDVVIATSPSLFTGLTGLMVARIKGIPLVFEVRDLWPEVITAIGAGNESSLSYKIFDKIASTLYNKSDLIIVVTESFKNEIILSRKIHSAKIKVIENAVDIEFFKPFTVAPEKITEMGLKDKFVVSYIGTIGYTHGVEVILRSAREIMRKFPDLLFLLVGSGSDKERLLKIKNDLELENIKFIEQQPKTMVPTFINASDISLVLSIKKPLFHKTIFAKVFEPMACSIPIIVGAVGETRNIVIERANAGIDFEPEDVQGLIGAITQLYKDAELRKNLGQNGREFVTREFSRTVKAIKYVEILDTLVKYWKTEK